jgi:hypothetical protein
MTFSHSSSWCDVSISAEANLHFSLTFLVPGTREAIPVTLWESHGAGSRRV